MIKIGSLVKATVLGYEKIGVTLIEDARYVIENINPLTPELCTISLNGKVIKGRREKDNKLIKVSFSIVNFKEYKVPSAYIYAKKTKYEKIKL